MTKLHDLRHRFPFLLPALFISAIIFILFSFHHMPSTLQIQANPLPPDMDSTVLSGKHFRIVAIGDSITEGYGSSDHNGYRQHLQRELSTAGATVEYIGTLKSGDMANPEHEGYGAFTISQVGGVIGLNMSLAAKPNVVLLHVGTNDLMTAFPWEPYKEAPTRLGMLMDQILAVVPAETTLLVAQIIQGWGVFKGFKSRTKTFNDEIPAVVRQRTDRGAKVVIVDMSNVGIEGDMLEDGLHPDDRGYVYMGHEWFKALVQLVNSGLYSPPPQDS